MNVNMSERMNFLRLAAAACLLAAFTLSPPAARASSTDVIGVIEPLADVNLSAPVPGIITARKFKEGDFVKEGDAVIELDKRLEELEVERRKVVMDSRRVDFEGTAKLFQTTKGTSKDELEKKETDYKQAVVEHAMAVEQLRRRIVTAPLAGTLVELPRQVGESCQPYQSIARLVETRRCYFVANIESALAATLKLAQKVQLEVETGAGVETVSGVISFLSPVADPASGLVRVKALFENSTGKIRPGLTGRMPMK